MAKLYTANEVRAMLMKICRKRGDKKKFANANGVDPSLVSYTISGAREPRGKICAALKLRPVTLYEKTGD